MSAEKRPRKLSVGLWNCETHTSWGDSRMTFIDGTGDSARKEVTLHIKSPYDLLYIEKQIAKIRAEWKRQLELDK